MFGSTISRVPSRVRSGGGAFLTGSAAKLQALHGRRLVGLVEGANVGAGRDNLIDTVEDLVGERDVDAGEQVVELLHGAQPEEGAGHAGVRDREGHGEVRHSQACLPRQRDELFDGVDAALVVEMTEQAGPAQVVVLALAHTPREQALRQRAHTSVPMP